MRQANISFSAKFLLKAFMLLILFFASFTALFGTERGTSLYVKSVFTTGGRISGAALADLRGGFLAFSEDRYLYSFYGNGDFRSRRRMPARPAPFHVQGHDGIIYKYFEDNTLRAINMRGSVLWSVRKETPPAFNPIVNSAGNIITVTESKITSYSFMGRKRWELAADAFAGQGVFFSTSLVSARAGGIVYAGMSDGTVAAINNHGQIVRTVRAAGAGIAALNAEGNAVIAADKSGRLFILDPRELKIIRSARLRSPALHITASGDNRVIAVLTEAGGVEMFDSELSLFLPRVRGAGFTGRPLYFNNNFYFVRNNGSIVKFDISYGITEELLIPRGAVYGLRTAADNANMPLALSVYNNMILAGGLDWNLYVIEERNYRASGRGSSQRQAGSQSIMFVRRAQNSVDIIPDTRLLIYINELLLLEDVTVRENAMNLLHKVVLDGVTGNDEKFVLAILERHAFPETERNAVIRSKAVIIAAEIGTIETVSMLRSMLWAERCPFVTSVIIEELGKAGSDPHGETVRMFQTAHSRFPDNLAIIENIIAGIENINRYHGYLYKNEGKNFLFRILERTERRDLRLRILNAVRNLAQ
ncbi:MAG: PQQ-like beta-propeller repeat protein [Spirochaetes bacterium]|nr:PQQ-like beta-propeller repeat protein [Spirochaetota bacterium]